MPADPESIDPSLTDPELAAALVTEAGALAAAMRAAGLQTSYKTSVSDVVSEADTAAEAFIGAAIRRARPGDGIFGEEGASHQGTSGRCWVIDPVDGTYNFLSGLPYWCSALALRDSAGVALGAVRQPATGETWLGGRDLPTTLNGVPVQQLTDHRLDQISLATYIHPPTLADDDALIPFLALVSGAATPRILGSGSMDLAGVACGRLGAWAQPGCPDWDWLPGKALVEAAGGSTAVIEHRGRRWHLAGNGLAVAELTHRLLAS
ncbi:MAG: inositol monophosphatase [Actinomycetota bacterium]|nr:inositol monophosphatase [Actinomycetota bacterium]